VEGLKIVGLCIVSAVIYGILHDLVTANLCVEYFSVFHPDIFHTDSPWLLALGWGVIATWWMGLFLGPLIAAAARSGELPKIGWRALVRPLIVVLLCSYSAALASGLIGFTVVRKIPDWIYKNVPRMQGVRFAPDKERLFTADLFAHNASYFTAGLGALVLCIWIIRKRMKMHRPLIVGQRPI
jgi:hypothetical protein